MLFRDSVFQMTNVRSSFLFEHFESLIRDIAESSVLRCASAKALSEASRLSSFPRSDRFRAAWFLFGFGVKHSVRLRCLLVLGWGGSFVFADVGHFCSDCESLSSGDLEVTKGLGGRKIIFCAGHTRELISLDSRGWKSEGEDGDISLDAELEKIWSGGKGFMIIVPENDLWKDTGASRSEAASCSALLFCFLWMSQHGA